MPEGLDGDAINTTIQLLADGTAVIVLTQAGQEIVIKTKSALRAIRNLFQAIDLNPPSWIEFKDEREHQPAVPDWVKQLPAYPEGDAPVWLNGLKTAPLAEDGYTLEEGVIG